MQLTVAVPRTCPISRIESGSFNYGIWIKRILITSWILYALGVALFPFWDEAKERNRAFARATASYEFCKTAAIERHTADKQTECEDVYRARVERDNETYHMGSEYRAMGWHLAWTVPAAMFAPPLILFFTVYAFVFATRLTVRLGKKILQA